MILVFRAVLETLGISMPTLFDVARGRLDQTICDQRLVVHVTVHDPVDPMEYGRRRLPELMAHVRARLETPLVGLEDGRLPLTRKMEGPRVGCLE